MNERNLYDQIVIEPSKCAGDPAKTIGDLILLLTRQGEVCKVYDDDGFGDVIIIQHGHDEHQEGWGSPSLVWISDEELEDYYSIKGAVTNVEEY